MNRPAAYFFVGRRVDELTGDANCLSSLLHRSFEHVADAQLAADLLHVDGTALVSEIRIAVDLFRYATRADLSAMQSIRLSVPRRELLRALQTLSTTRRRRFSSSLPIWMTLRPDGDELQITEDRSEVGARVPAKGSWPPAGATVDLYMLKRAVINVTGEVVDLHALDSAVVVYGDRWHVRLNLLAFGPESRRQSRRPVELAESSMPELLPLFLWASRRP